LIRLSTGPIFPSATMRGSLAECIKPWWFYLGIACTWERCRYKRWIVRNANENPKLLDGKLEGLGATKKTRNRLSSLFYDWSESDRTSETRTTPDLRSGVRLFEKKVTDPLFNTLYSEFSGSIMRLEYLAEWHACHQSYLTILRNCKRKAF
jgi:hypothetical protein